ncbi:hypothetical protein ACFL28_02275 [Candidatus Omnitrophota bacterium]
MRELVFKNLISEDKRRRDLIISEIIEENGIKTVTERHTVYIIRDHKRFDNTKDLVEWQKDCPVNRDRRHVFIFKKRDTKLQKDSFVCDVVGKFYAVVNKEVYSIAFKHSFEMDFVATEQK